MAVSTNPGPPNLPGAGGGGGISAPGPQDVILVDAAYTANSSSSNILVKGIVQGVYGNQSVFGPGPYAITIVNGERRVIGASVGSGGLR